MSKAPRPISTAGMVAYSTVEDVKETLEIMMPGGGNCLSPTHSLQDNSPVENVVANMVDNIYPNMILLQIIKSCY